MVSYYSLRHGSGLRWEQSVKSVGFEPVVKEQAHDA